MNNINGDLSNYSIIQDLKLIKDENKKAKVLTSNSYRYKSYLQGLSSVLEKIQILNKSTFIESKTAKKLEKRVLKLSKYLSEEKNISSIIKLSKMLSKHRSVLSKDLYTQFSKSIKKMMKIDIIKKLNPEMCKDILLYKLDEAQIQYPHSIHFGKVGHLVNVLRNLKEGEEFCFIYRSKVSDEMPLHTIPLICRYTKDKLEILSIDSTGYRSAWMPVLRNCVMELKLDAPVNFSTVDIVRQNSSTGCTIFAIEDIFNYIKLKEKGIDLFDLIEDGIIHLPPEMMELTQSTSVHKSYMRSLPDDQKLRANRLNQVFEEHLYLKKSSSKAKPLNIRTDIEWTYFAAMHLENSLKEK